MSGCVGDGRQVLSAVQSSHPPVCDDFSLMCLCCQETVEETVPVTGSSAGVNALGLVVFSMCFGLVIGNMKEQGQPLRDFFDCLNEAIMRLVAIIIWSVAGCSDP